MFFITGCSDTSTIINASKLSSGKAVLSWENVPDAISYNVYFSRSPGILKNRAYKIANVTSPFTIVDLEPEKTYYLVVAAVDASGERSSFKEKSFTATAGEASVYFENLESHVTLTWENVSNADFYNIYYGDAPGVTKANGKKIARVKNPHTIKDLERGKTYYFVVTAAGASGESKESEEISFSAK